MSKETVEEFLARGGVITKVVSADIVADTAFVHVPLHIQYDSLSLGDAEFRLGKSTFSSRKEAKKMILNSKTSFPTLLKNCNISEEIKESIRKRMNSENICKD